MGGTQSVFGPFVLDRERRLLLLRGEAVHVGHRGYLILEALLDANGETVAKQALLDHAWPGGIVASLALAGQHQRAQDALQHLRQIAPQWSSAVLMKGPQGIGWARLREGLRLAITRSG